jgi:hypothetical protein
MRKLVFALVVTVVGSPCSARTILKSEPLVLAPYAVAYVQDASCGAGKVLKVTGAIRGLDRKRVCVALDNVQTSLVAHAP